MLQAAPLAASLCRLGTACRDAPRPAPLAVELLPLPTERRLVGPATYGTVKLAAAPTVKTATPAVILAAEALLNRRKGAIVMLEIYALDDAVTLPEKIPLPLCPLLTFGNTALRTLFLTAFASPNYSI